MHLIDTHAHLVDDALRSQLDLVLQRADHASVRQIINVATTYESSRLSVAMSDDNAGVYATAGIHPNYAQSACETDFENIVELCMHPRVVALGETGLDKYWDDCPWPVQVANFRRHIELSLSNELPLIIHTRDCWDEMLELLGEYAHRSRLTGVMHSFTGNRAQAERAMEFGLYISFAGMLTYKKSSDLREVVAHIPDDRLLVETDCPYLSPEPKRGHRPNEPALIVHTAAVLAKCRHVELAAIAEQTTHNARQLFVKMTDQVLESKGIPHG